MEYLHQTRSRQEKAEDKPANAPAACGHKRLEELGRRDVETDGTLFGDE
jgi:hypothetical protein